MLTMNNVTDKTGRPQESTGPFSLSPGTIPLGIILVGVLLILSSFLSLGELAARSEWTDQSATDYATLSEQYHRSAYQTGRKGNLTTKQEHQHQQLKISFDTMRNKLKRAQGQPQRWSRYLLGIGTLLTAAGFFAHTSRSS